MGGVAVSRRTKFNKLSAAEEERLALLMEEMGKCIQVIGKIMRHGYESKHPAGGLTNRQLLETEIGHVKYAKILMIRCGDIDFSKTKLAAVSKSHTISGYLHHQPVDKIRIKLSVESMNKIAKNKWK